MTGHSDRIEAVFFDNDVRRVANARWGRLGALLRGCDVLRDLAHRRGPDAV